jgi:hypothetical protein
MGHKTVGWCIDRTFARRLREEHVLKRSMIEPRLELVWSTNLRSVLHACWGRVEDRDVVAVVGVDEMHRVLCTVPIGDLDENGHQGKDLKKGRTCQFQANTSCRQQGERILASRSGRKPR